VGREVEGRTSGNSQKGNVLKWRDRKRSSPICLSLGNLGCGCEENCGKKEDSLYWKNVETPNLPPKKVENSMMRRKEGQTFRIKMEM